MKKFIVCLLLGALLGMISPLLPAQQTQSRQKSDTEIEVLEKRVSELEKQLQTVENVEKMELQAKLADANAKLINANFGTLKEKVWVDNEERMRRWSHWFFGMLGIIVVISGGAIWLLLKSLIADRVEKNLNGFKEAVGQVEVMKDELRVLKKDHAASMLKDFIHLYYFSDKYPYPERIMTLPEEDLLEVFGDEIYDLEVRYRAAEVLVDRKSPQLVSPLLKFINSIVYADANLHPKIEDLLCGFVGLLGQIHTQEVYHGLTKFLNRLLTEDLKHKEMLLTWTAFSLAIISYELSKRDSISILRKAMTHLKSQQNPHPMGHLVGGITKSNGLINLARYFDRYSEPEGIKEILTKHVTSGMSGTENRCLELLQKYDPEFVAEWRAGEPKENSNT